MHCLVPVEVKGGGQRHKADGGADDAGHDDGRAPRTFTNQMLLDVKSAEKMEGRTYFSGLMSTLTLADMVVCRSEPKMGTLTLRAYRSVRVQGSLATV